VKKFLAVAAIALILGVYGALHSQMMATQAWAVQTQKLPRKIPQACINYWNQVHDPHVKEEIRDWGECTEARSPMYRTVMKWAVRAGLALPVVAVIVLFLSAAKGPPSYQSPYSSGTAPTGEKTAHPPWQL
jgi:hypothetical protein